MQVEGETIMNEMINSDKKYQEWIKGIADDFRKSQIKAAMSVNSEMLHFYWSLGHDMDIRKEEYSWGSHFYEQVSRDLKKLLPDVKSFSPRNLLYMHQFYRLFQSAGTTKQDASQLDQPGFTKQLVSQLSDCTNPEEYVFYIPWGHVIAIMGKCGSNRDKALFFVKKTFDNNWSRAVLLNFLDTDLFERQGKAITNFSATLPPVESDLAQAITKDPYNFDFLMIRESYDEKELKDALMDNITKFLLELGNGFAFVGREVRLMMGETENYADMLFYNIKLHRYVVVEVKVTEFDSRDMGQLGTYMVAVNYELKGHGDGDTLGLLICKSKDNVKARYALEASSQPIGISEYDISAFMPEEFKGSLPTIEEIESELGNNK